MSCLTSLCLDAVCPSFPQWCSTEHHSAAPTVWAGEVPWNDFRASTLCATWKKISHCTIVKNSTNPPDLSCCLHRALWEEDGEVGVQMEAFSLKAPLALSCSFTLFETHQLLEVKYSLCLFPEHLCSWLCTPMSPSAVYSCCPNISQHPSAGVAALGPWSASPLCCCTPQNLPSGFPGCTAPAPFQVGHLTGGVLLQGGEGGWWDMRGDRTARWSLAFLSGQNSHRCDYSPFPKLLVACRRTEFQEMHHLFSS